MQMGGLTEMRSQQFGPVRPPRQHAELRILISGHLLPHEDSPSAVSECQALDPSSQYLVSVLGEDSYARTRLYY